MSQNKLKLNADKTEVLVLGTPKQRAKISVPSISVNCKIVKICKLQRVQNNAARVITLTKKHDHITPVLKELHWLPVRKRIEFKILLLAYKCLHGTAPSYLRELLKEYVPPRTLRST